MPPVTQTRHIQATATEETFRPPRVRTRASILEEAARLQAVYEEAIQKLQASLAKAQEEITVLKAEIAQVQTGAQQSAAVSQAAIDALEATVETEKQTIEDLRRQNADLEAIKKKHLDAFRSLQEYVSMANGPDVSRKDAMRCIGVALSIIQQNIQEKGRI